MIQLLADGRAAFDTLKSRGGDASSRRHLIRLARLRFLAPDIIKAVIDGRQPTELTSRALLRVADLPLSWQRQSEMLGFG